MIKADFFRNKNNNIYGFRVKDHGASIVCAAVSALTLNCVNSIDEFTNCDFVCEHNDEGGFIDVLVPFIKEGGFDHDVDLIFNCLLLGLSGIKAEYENDITIFDCEV